jgi:capsular exopolysaccharide synthesis family protein
MYRLALLLYPRSAAAEGYRSLRTNLEFASVDSPIETLLVTSAMPGEGKTVTAANLAIVFAQAGRRVLLVDADLRKPGVHTPFNIVNGRGLTTMLRGVETDVASLAHQTEEDNLRVLTAGPLPPNPAELLGSQRMRAVMDLLKADADLVIFDSPPLEAVTDSAILSSLVDGTLLVVDTARSRRRAVRLAREALERAGAKVLGAVLNRVPAPSGVGYDYYGGYHGAGSPPSKPVPALENVADHHQS